MAKFSVKKPLTVLVCVIAILVLGVVSFMNMTPDLLPSMDLPYVMLITSYPGASPEKVEMVVTKPLEQGMATLENIENITSTSNENVSIIFLEFAAEVNLEATTVDMLQTISQIEGYWDDMVGTPLILKLNPDMLPVMVAAVEMEGSDTAALSRFVDEELHNKLEGISGVASVSVSGLVEEQVNVVLSQGKIDVLNQRIANAINAEFDDAEAELRNTRAELRQKLAELDAAVAELEDGLATLRAGNAEANKKEIELMEGRLALTKQMKQLEEGLAALNEQEEQLALLYQPLSAAAQIETATAARLAGFAEAAPAAAAVQSAWDDMITGLVAAGRADLGGITDDERRAILQQESDANHAEYMAWKTTAEDPLLQALAPLGISSVFDFTAAHTQAAAEDAAAKAALAGVEDMLVSVGTSRAEVEAGWEALQNGKAQLQLSIAKLQEMLDGLEAGEIQLQTALNKLDEVKLETQSALALKGPQLTVAQTELEKALKEIDSGLEKLEEAREDTLAQADMGKTITMDMVSNLLVAQNFSMPAGYVYGDGQEYLVRVGNEVTSPDELYSMPLFDSGVDDIGVVTLGDVADVFVSDNLDSLYAKINGNDGVLVSFNKQSTYATADVTGNISSRFQQLSEEYPGLHFTSLMDQGDYIFIVVNSILNNLAMGALFAIVVLFLFLKDLRPTFITLCSIPISVVFAITLMYFSGVTINIISLSGLAVSVGMLVDNSVVVIENIFRLRSKGYSAIKAAVSGASQVAAAITSSTLTTICVFAPIVFVQGITRQLFTDMALTLAYSLLASLVVAMTLVPTMAGGMFRKMEEKPNKTMSRITGGYAGALGWVLRHKVVVVLAALLLLVGSTALVIMRGFSFMPAMDMPQLNVTVSMKDEEATFEQLKATGDEVAERIGQLDGVETVGVLAGGGTMMNIMGMGGLGGGSDEQATRATMYVMVSEDVGGNAVAEEIRRVTADIEDAEVVVSSSSAMDMSALGGSGISVNIYGNNTDELFAAARQVAGVLEGVEGAAKVDDGIGETNPEIRFVVDKQRAAEEGLTVAQVYAEISKALATEKSATSITWEGNSYDVIVVQASEETLTPTYIEYLSFAVTDRDGEERTVNIQNIADVQRTESATSISRNQQRRYITVSAEVAEGHNVSLVAQAAQRELRGESLPAGTSYEMAGENETIMDAFRDLFNMMLLGILLVYLIMVAQFQSLKSPFVVMFTIPLAFTGGLLALLITGFELSVVALIGFVMLVGVIVNNGIVLVDYINQLRAEGMERQEAIKEAGATRLRPILMTSITTVLGLFTMALGLGTGAELMQPVAIVSIGGLVYGTLMTLFVVPAIYDWLNRKELRVIDEEELTVTED